MSTPRGNLPPINFTKKSAETTIANIITTYEAIAGRSLLPGDPVRLFLQSVAAIIVQQRNVIDFAAKQNLLSYVTDDYVDYLGELVGVTRLEATPALTTIRFTLSAPRASVYTIPAGVQVSLSGQITFATTEPLEIPIGSVTGDVSAECTEPLAMASLQARFSALWSRCLLFSQQLTLPPVPAGQTVKALRAWLTVSALRHHRSALPALLMLMCIGL